MKILLTGTTGQVGRRLVERLEPLGDLIALDRQQLDLSSPDHIRRTLFSFAPDLIINPAAFTAVDRAESEYAIAHAINAVAPGIIGEVANQLGATVIHFSTDYVFDGQSATPYRESDQTCPINRYGVTKRDGEVALLASKANALILRTSWVFDSEGHNFLRTMLRLACERDTLRVVSDQLGAPTSARSLADAVAAIVATDAFRTHQQELTGIYHATASGQTSWHHYASHAIAYARSHDWPIRVTADAIQAVSSDAFPTAAKRPRNSQLDTSKIQKQFDLSLPDWTTLVESEISAMEPIRV